MLDSKALLERAFPVVYGVELRDVLPRADLAIGSYRFAISRLIPEMTQVALQTHGKDLMREVPSFAKEKFLYRLSRSDYEREWGKDYRKPGILSRILAGIIRFLPKIGPFKPLGFDNPTAATEELYFESINATVDHYRAFLADVRSGSLDLPNRDLDDGNTTRAAEYSLADDVYAQLLVRQSRRQFDLTTADLRANILNFYANLSSPITTKADRKRWQRILADLERLKAATPAAAGGSRE